MTAEAMARSQLAHRASDLARLSKTRELTVVEVGNPFQLDLRLDPDHASLAPFPLPLDTNTALETAELAVLWLGPDEWLVSAGVGDAFAITAQLEAALAGIHHSVVDVSANRAVLEIGGARAAEVVSKGCPLDLHPRSWRPGMCAQTLLERVPVILHERETTTRLYVRPSFGDYLVDWLLDAAR